MLAGAFFAPASICATRIVSRAAAGAAECPAGGAFPLNPPQAAYAKRMLTGGGARLRRVPNAEKHGSAANRPPAISRSLRSLEILAPAWLADRQTVRFPFFFASVALLATQKSGDPARSVWLPALPRLARAPGARRPGFAPTSIIPAFRCAPAGRDSSAAPPPGCRLDRGSAPACVDQPGLSLALHLPSFLLAAP